jgi:hypothetical protein
MLKNSRPSISPASTRRSRPRIAASIASAGCHGTPSSAAKPFPDPAGTMPSAVEVPATTVQHGDGFARCHLASQDFTYT